jgi:hypothetical protein
LLFRPNSQSLQQAQTANEVRTLLAMISRVVNPRSPANGDGRAAEITTEFNAHLSPWLSARTRRSEKDRHRVCRVTRSYSSGGPCRRRPRQTGNLSERALVDVDPAIIILTCVRLQATAEFDANTELHPQGTEEPLGGG